MNVVLLASGFPAADRADIGIFTLRGVQALQRLHSVRVLHLRSWRPGRPFRAHYDVEGVPVTAVAVPQVPHAFGSKAVVAANFAVYARAAWLLVRDAIRRADVLHSVGASFAGIVGGYWRRRAGVPHVVQTIGSDVNSILPRVQSWPLIRGWQRRCDAVVCNSRALAGAVRALCPDAPDVEVVYRGTDLTRFTPAANHAGGPVRFLFLGGFQPYPELPGGRNTKGGETLCEAWKQREEELHRAGATLVLGGPAADVATLAAWRSSLRHPESVTILGVVPPAAVADAVRGASVVLVPSLEEGLPNLAVEAEACGVPVFGSDVGGIPEVVQHGQTGLILPPADPNAWADALAAYASRPDELRAMGQRARRRVEALFDAAEYGRRMTAVYERVIQRR